MFKLTDYLSEEQLKSICSEYHIKKISLFGSALRDELTSDSDIDILVEFVYGKAPGLMGFCHLQNLLTDLVGKKIELHTPNDLSRYFRDDVVKDAVIQYGY
ncbi:MAG: nucleotidyltransferase domain-containing protein [Deltaproteobacteria bacterium]|nr:nucleotidyltransferase domain-containing protein [Deltaproteobacteria bacterium]